MCILENLRKTSIPAKPEFQKIRRGYPRDLHNANYYKIWDFSKAPTCVSWKTLRKTSIDAKPEFQKIRRGYTRDFHRADYDKS